MTTWMQYRIRTKWLDGNLPLVVLRLLREAPMDIWEMLASLHRIFGMSPDEKELEKLTASFLRLGYLKLTSTGGVSRFIIARDGLRLLSRLEQEYLALCER